MKATNSKLNKALCKKLYAVYKTALTRVHFHYHVMAGAELNRLRLALWQPLPWT